MLLKKKGGLVNAAAEIRTPGSGSSMRILEHPLYKPLRGQVGKLSILPVFKSYAEVRKEAMSRKCCS